jgi:hypothetical protein
VIAFVRVVIVFVRAVIVFVRAVIVFVRIVIAFVRAVIVFVRAVIVLVRVVIAFVRVVIVFVRVVIVFIRVVIVFLFSTGFLYQNSRLTRQKNICRIKFISVCRTFNTHNQLNMFFVQYKSADKDKKSFPIEKKIIVARQIFFKLRLSKTNIGINRQYIIPLTFHCIKRLQTAPQNSVSHLHIKITIPNFASGYLVKISLKDTDSEKEI